MSAVRVSGVTKAFGPVSVLRGLDLEIESGTFAAILGVSGCGKSTLLRLLAGFDYVDEGEIEIGSKVVDDGARHVPPNRRRVGYVPQEGALFPHLDVRANIAFGLPRPERGGARVDELVALVGLEGLERRRPNELSGGQQQRVALARTLATKPDVVLLDEPFAALDPELRASMRAEVRQTLKGLGTTAVLVTHDQEEALSSADTVAILRDGVISQVGSPRDLYLSPRDVEVARFLGEANILPAHLDGGRADTRLGPLLVRARRRADEPCEGVVVVRPEELRLAAANGNGPPNAVVTAVEYYGHDARVELCCSHPDGEYTLIARTTGAEAPEVGERVCCSPPGSTHAI
ncbi:MAG: iron(III) transport system ATP-binding protein [Solirubrobacteraceae bacterium]|jgi:iron(III) transport system ATP-binding protein|nr:iron(III) transport system ATP-binding protein [Solirubrobacteraceae bacterium]